MSAAPSRFSVTADSRRLRRELGPTAWAVLEDVVLDAQADDGRLMAGTNVRRLSAHLGVSKDAAARALGRLLDAGLVVRHHSGHRADGTFGPVAYELVAERMSGVHLSMRTELVGGRAGKVDDRPGRRGAAPSSRRAPAVQPGLFDGDADAVVAR